MAYTYFLKKVIEDTEVALAKVNSEDPLYARLKNKLDKYKGVLKEREGETPTPEPAPKTTPVKKGRRKIK